MIRYPVSAAELERQVSAEASSWLARAKTRTDRFRTLGRYEEESSIWSEIKVVYMRLQGGSKCAYCERKMEDPEHGRGEQDVEHFRPKGRVSPWQAPRSLAGVPLTRPPTGGKGYYLLPYDLWNYAASCKPCNSALKGDRFPIAGTYNTAAESLGDRRAEKPYLIYPIGTIDDDPESLIRFHGTSPQPVGTRGYKRNRALVTIAFFHLDDPVERKNLFRDRALVIIALHPLLRDTENGSPQERRAATRRVDDLLKPSLQHLNCATCFRELFTRDRQAADSVFTAALEFLTSTS